MSDTWPPKSSMAKRPLSARQADAPVFQSNGAIILTVERKEITPIKVSVGGIGLSIGRTIDIMLSDAVRRGDVIASVTVDLSDDAWKALSSGSVEDVSTDMETKQA